VFHDFHQSFQAVLFLFVSCYVFCTFQLYHTSMYCFSAQHRIRVDITPPSHSGGPKFESRLLNRPSWLRYLYLRLVPQTDNGISPQIGSRSPFCTFSIQYSLLFYHQPLHNMSYWQRRSVNTCFSALSHVAETYCYYCDVFAQTIARQRLNIHPAIRARDNRTNFIADC
jgi:hypothetical protein